MLSRVRALLIAGLLPVAGCTSMITTEHLDDRRTGPVRDGAVSYALPMTLLKLNVTRYEVRDKVFKYEISSFNDPQVCKSDGGKFCSEILTVADPVHAYVVKYRGNALFDDDLSLAVNKDGFLTGATGKAKDRSADILVGAVRIAARDFPQPKPYSSLDKLEQVDTVLVDPHDPAFLKGANARLARYGMQVSCDLCAPRAAPVRGESEEIYYRQRRTAYLQVADMRGHVIAVHPFPTFNGSPLIANRLERSPFVERETAIVYDNGVAQSVTHKKPSEGLGLVTAVGNIAGAVVFSPFNALTAQTSNLSTEKKYLEAREALLKQQQASTVVVAGAVPAAGAPTSYSGFNQPQQTASAPPQDEARNAKQIFEQQQQLQQQQLQIQQLQQQLGTQPQRQ
jgi:hypothetical protein